MATGDDRLFLAVPLTPEVREGLAGWLRSAFPAGVPGRAVPAESWHMTLRFLGETAPQAARDVRRELSATPLGEPFPLRFGRPGAFPRPARARVLWLGLEEGGEGLATLAGRVEAAVRRAGFAREERAFTPHLTLSRLKVPQDVGEVLGAAPRFGASMAVTEVVLFRSVLGRGPARYEVVERFPI